MKDREMENSLRVKDAEYARKAIAFTSKGTPSQKARIAISKMACGNFGNYTPEAKKLWAAYLEAGCPSA